MDKENLKLREQESIIKIGITNKMTYFFTGKFEPKWLRFAKLEAIDSTGLQ